MATQTATNAFGRNRLEAKVAIIAGRDEGIDRAITSRLAAGGADIAFFAAAVTAAARNKWVYLKGTEEVTRAGLLERQHHSSQQIGRPPLTEIAEAIVFLATDHSSFIQGAKLAVHGGRTTFKTGQFAHSKRIRRKLRPLFFF